MTPGIGPDLLTGGFFVRIFLPIICGHYAKNEVLLTNLVKFGGGGNGEASPHYRPATAHQPTVY